MTSKIEVRLHLTNIAGLGAIRLLQSLLPKLETVRGYQVTEIYLPDSGELSKYIPSDQSILLKRYKRWLPNAISRLLECTLLAGVFDGETPLLVLGDIPLNCKAKQTVFVQTPMLSNNLVSQGVSDAIKYAVARWLFQRNSPYVEAFVVQTEAMRYAMAKAYPQIKARLHVIPQPPPRWLLDSGVRRFSNNVREGSRLRLIYPAATYPHKNHRLLSKVVDDQTCCWPIDELVLTIPDQENPNPSIPWMRCVDRLESNEMLKFYEKTDALLFLSLSESLGLPLIEAMWLGLPIVCPDLPYARVLCGDMAIYFDPADIHSLHAAVVNLKEKLDSGWWPDWSVNLADIPETWEEVASSILEIAAPLRIKEETIAGSRKG